MLIKNFEKFGSTPQEDFELMQTLSLTLKITRNQNLRRLSNSLDRFVELDNHTSGNEIFRQMAKSIHFAINAFANFERFFFWQKNCNFPSFLMGYCFFTKYLLLWKRHRFEMNSMTKNTYLYLLLYSFSLYMYSTFFYTNVISICFKMHQSLVFDT